jgi:hypothetical protein
MKSKARLFPVVAAAVSLVASLLGCGDPTATQDAALPPGLPHYGVLSWPQKAIGAKRSTTFDGDVSVSGLIGPSGGALNIKEAGLRVVFPVGAVDKWVWVTVTAKRGDALAYDFQPHGLTFKVPVKLTQRLPNIDTTTPLKNVFLGYFPNAESLDPVTRTAVITEALPAEIGLEDDLVRARIYHFSGYLVAIGCDGPAF